MAQNNFEQTMNDLVRVNHDMVARVTRLEAESAQLNQRHTAHEQAFMGHEQVHLALDANVGAMGQQVTDMVTGMQAMGDRLERFIDAMTTRADTVDVAMQEHDAKFRQLDLGVIGTMSARVD